MSGQITLNTSASGSILTIERSDGAFIDLPLDWFTFSDSGLKRRTKIVDKLRADGGFATGDGTFDSRTITLTYAQGATTDSIMRTGLNTLEAFFTNDYRYYFLNKGDPDLELRCEVKLLENMVKFQPGQRLRVAQCIIKFGMLDALWQTVDIKGYPGGTGSRTGDETGGTTGTGSGAGVVLSNGSKVTVTNGGPFRAYPIMYINALDNIVNFSISNNTLNGGIEFDSNDILAGSELVIDCEQGTVYLEGVERSAVISSGGFFYLVPGANEIEYSCLNGNISFEIIWRERYAY